MAKKRIEAPKLRPQTTARPNTPTTESSASGQSNTYNWLGWVAAALGILLYINTLGHYYTLDDYSAIKENLITQKGLAGIPELFTSEYRAGAWNSPGTLYRPLTLSMFAVEWQISPDNPMPGHLINILLYGLTGWLLFTVWRRILSGYSPVLAGVITLLFIAHPVHTEVVANIKSRDEILSLLFCTATLWCTWNYLDRNRVSALVWALVCYALALFSKESSITWLAVLPLTVWFFRNETAGRTLRTAAWFVIPAGLFLAARANALSNQKGKEIFNVLDNFLVGAPEYSMKWLSGAFMMCYQYLVTLVLPMQLVSDRGFPQFDVNQVASWQAALGFLALAGAGIWALTQLGRKSIFAYAVLFYLATFSLFSNILIPIGTSYGERLLYLPSFGFAVGLGWALYQLHQKGTFSSSVLWMIVGGIVAVYSLRTVTRNPDWKTSYALYQSDIPKSPNCAKLTYHLGIEQAKEALDSTESIVVAPAWLDTAINSYNRAMMLYPLYSDCYSARGLAYFRAKRYDEAYADYQKALANRPDDSKVLSNTGFIYFLRGDLVKAEEVYRKSIAIDPRFVDARRNLGAVLAMTKRFPQAIEQFEAGLKFEPRSAILWFYIGSAYRDMGQLDKAQPYFDKAYALDPKLKK
jgi:protein O-mannosyl-transferase